MQSTSEEMARGPSHGGVPAAGKLDRRKGRSVAGAQDDRVSLERPLQNFQVFQLPISELSGGQT